jgi:GINS complex subunit 4
MADSDDGDDRALPRFSFGEMALPDEPARVLPRGGVVGSTDGGADGDGAGNGVRRSVFGGITAAPVLNDSISKLRTAVLNEQNAPELLPYESEIVTTARSLVSQQTDRVDDEEDVAEASLETHLQRMEIDRINYMLRTYFRVRIKKIESFVWFLHSNEELLALLSQNEQLFVNKYRDLAEQHFSTSFLSMLPERLQKVQEKNEIGAGTAPDLEKFVFCRVNRTIGSYALSENSMDEPFDLSKDDVICARYAGIRKLLADGDVVLI